jgi:hypothetical protein
VTTDGSGGAIVVWMGGKGFSVMAQDVYAQRIDQNGNILWQPNGIIVNDSSSYAVIPKVSTDMIGGAIICYFGPGNGNLLVQRLDGAGNRLWPIDIIHPFTGGAHQIISDGIGGSIVVGRALDYKILSQWIDSNGVILWDTAGVIASTLSNVVSFPLSTSDLASGVIISWKYGADVYAQRVDSSSSLLWGPDGIVACDFSASKWPGVPVTDGNSGAIIYWSDNRFNSGTNPNDWFAQRISSTGSVMWDTNGVPISLRDGEQVRGGIISDGFGGAILAWEDFGVGWLDIYAQNVNGDGSLGPVGIEEETSEFGVRIAEFGLKQNFPNPFSNLTAISYQIPNSHPASRISPASLSGGHHVSLNIYDVSGRLVKTLVNDSQESGVYRVQWTGLDDSGEKVSSGIYYYQLRTSDFQSVRKVILVR